MMMEMLSLFFPKCNTTGIRGEANNNDDVD